MKDIWSIPPGGPVATTTKERPWLRSAIAAFVIISLGLGAGGMIKWMRSSTPVSVDTALEEFRAARPVPTEDTENNVAGESDKRRTDKGRSQRGGGGNNGATTSGGAVASAAEGGAGSATETAGTTGGAQERTAEPDARTRPEEGVYTWAVDGFEEAPGTRRQLPERSHRVITHGNGQAWDEHHIFSEQKEQWFGLEMTPEGVVTNSVRNRVVFGPVTNDKTITFSPAMFVSRLPLTLGEKWEGQWKGKTSGSYTARCFEHTTLVISGERVEVWATEVKMTMRGEIEGTSTVRSWVSPERVLVVKQYQETEVKSGPADYYSEWSGQVTSLEPQR